LVLISQRRPAAPEQCKRTPENTLPPIRTAAGITRLGEQVVVHGRDLHGDCIEQSYVQHLLFCASGQPFDARTARVFEKLWIATAYADVRIWCNRIAAYMGSARVPPALSMCAALSACSGTAYGFGAMRAAYAVQLAIPEPLAEREAWLEAKLASRCVIAGYGRPIHNGDERIPVAFKTLAEAGLRAGPALRRAYWLHRRLQGAKGIEANIAAIWAAIAIDLGIAPTEYDEFMLLMFAPGYVAAYADQRSREPLTFLHGYQTTLPTAEPAPRPPSASGLRPAAARTLPEECRRGGSRDEGAAKRRCGGH
jgi:citrate synthase